MNKQKYIKPAMRAVEIKRVSLLVGSLNSVKGNANLIFHGPGTTPARSRGVGNDDDDDLNYEDQ